MTDDEIRQFMAQLLTKLDAIEDKVSRLYDQTDDAKWERAKQYQQLPPAREVTDAEWDRLETERVREAISRGQRAY